MFGWFKAEAERASCSKRWRRPGSEAVAAGSTFKATSRPSRASVARYTSPIPPAPIEAVMRYCESVRPIMRAVGILQSGLRSVPECGGEDEAAPALGTVDGAGGGGTPPLHQERERARGSASHS